MYTKDMKATFKPNLEEINKDIGAACKDSHQKYYCDNLERIAYWLANPHMHSDRTFIAACSSTFTLISDASIQNDIEYHMRQLFSNREHPSVIVKAINDFTSYFKMPIRPDLANISEVLGKECAKVNGEYSWQNGYACRNLDRVAYWLANPHMHSDRVFIASCTGILGAPAECAKRDTYYHIRELMEDKYHPQEIEKTIRDFENYFSPTREQV